MLAFELSYADRRSHCMGVAPCAIMPVFAAVLLRDGVRVCAVCYKPVHVHLSLSVWKHKPVRAWVPAVPVHL